MSAAPLHLIVLQPDLERLSAYAARHRVLPLSGGDLGYALHHGLTALFGQAAPKPFRLIERRSAAQLLAYSPHDESALRDYAELQSASTPHYAAAAAALGLDGLALKLMPARWTRGRRYRFEARLRPVVRTTRNDPRKTGGGREIDAFIAAVAAAHAGENLDREAIYEDWIAAALLRSGGATLEAEALKLIASKRTRLHTRARSGQTLIEGPDIVAQGVLRVDEPDGFAALLARGLGRHRAFGFGMLLLSPAG